MSLLRQCCIFLLCSVLFVYSCRIVFPSLPSLVVSSSCTVVFPSSHSIIFPSYCSVVFPSSNSIVFLYSSSIVAPSVCSVSFPSYCSVVCPSSCSIVFPSSCSVVFLSSCCVVFPSYCNVEFPSWFIIVFLSCCSIAFPSSCNAAVADGMRAGSGCDRLSCGYIPVRPVHSGPTDHLVWLIVFTTSSHVALGTGEQTGLVHDSHKWFELYCNSCKFPDIKSIIRQYNCKVPALPCNTLNQGQGN